jgi:tRNA A37 N6-isopentenylltransferase MiaA
MLIAYRPDLENPPREGGFGVVTEAGLIQLAPGLNQEVPEQQWLKARQNATVKRLMAIGAIEEVQEQVTVEEIPQDVQTLSNLPLIEAFRVIEIIHDVEQLAEWKKIEGRVKVRNAIAKRQETIKAGRA